MDDIALNLAAARIMGKVALRVTGKGVLTTAGSVFRPATDIADAMRLVEAMRETGWDFDIMARRSWWKVAAFNA